LLFSLSYFTFELAGYFWFFPVYLGYSIVFAFV